MALYATLSQNVWPPLH